MHNPDITILEADPADLDLLIRWRMEVLHCVFSIPADADTTELKQANLDYYTKALSDDSHIACFASIDGQTVGCGGVCLYDEMPSPDNPTGHCAYIVRWLVGAALSRGIKKIYLETSEAGRLLYEVLGFSDMKDMMHLTFT